MEKAEARRAHARRVVAGLDLFCYLASGGPTPQFRRNLGHELQDISPGGARLRVVEPLDRGEMITIELRDRRSGEAFRARGEVRWCATRAAAAGQAYYVGVQFSEHYTPTELRDRFTLGAAAAAARQAGSPSAPLSEKRRTSRFAIDDYVVTCQRQGTLSPGGLKRNMARRVLDLGLNGAQLETSEMLDPNTVVRFTLTLNTFADTLESVANVRWCKPDPGIAGESYRAGLEFVNLGEDKKKMIEFMRKWFTSRKKKN
jgi:Tfp pilus assembly protein PilZ